MDIVQYADFRKGYILPFIYLCLVYIGPVYLHAQPSWENIGSGTDDEIYTLYVDTTANVLYAGGRFKYMDGIRVNGIAKWDGSSWDSLGKGFTFMGGGGYVSSVIKYRDHIYAAGIFDSSGNTPVNYIARWNGSRWDSVKGGANGIVNNLCVFKDELYVMGQFYHIDSKFAHLIAKWNDTTWARLDSTIWDGSFGNILQTAISYKDELIVGGRIRNLSMDIWKMARWNGSFWQAIPNTIASDLASVNSFAVFQGDLYVGGHYMMLANQFLNYIARWDGEQFYQVGQGVDSRVNKLFVYRDKLYAVGYFLEAGGVEASRIAKWDGEQWCGLGSEFDPNYSINDITVFNNELYIAGYFATIEGDTMNHIAKWSGENYTDSCGNLLANDSQTSISNNINVHPNPFHTTTTIFLQGIYDINQPFSFLLFDVSGKLVKEIEPLPIPKFTFHRSSLPNGIYLYQIMHNNSIIHSGKLVIH